MTGRLLHSSLAISMAFFNKCNRVRVRLHRKYEHDHNEYDYRVRLLSTITEYGYAVSVDEIVSRRLSTRTIPWRAAHSKRIGTRET